MKSHAGVFLQFSMYDCTLYCMKKYRDSMETGSEDA